jgi:putative ABC transport system permease protein
LASRKRNLNPPRWPQRFLEWYCKPALLEDLQGDLNEYFDRNVKAKGLFRAKLIYVADVLKFFRLYTVRKPEFINLLIHWIMIGSYLKTSGRTLVRNKLFSAINVIGLAVSMSVGLLVISMIHDFGSYDDFHTNENSIYRLTTQEKSARREINLASTSVKAGVKLKESVTGVDKVTLIRRGFGGDATVGNRTLPLTGFWADNAFLDVFTFPLIHGSKMTALKEAYSIVLTENAAKKMFGDQDALGKTVRFDTTNYTVTGVMQNIPKLSHLRFEALISFSTAELLQQDPDAGFMSWESIFMNYVYFTVPQKNDVDVVQSRLNRIAIEENKSLKDKAITLTVESLDNVVVGKNVGNPIGPSLNIVALYVLGGLAVVIMVSACFNYTNLSIARSLRRSREVGIRKVIGALKGHVITQFIAEAVLISLIALCFSFVLFLFLRMEFLDLNPFLSDIVSLELSTRLILYFIGLAIGIGVIAGVVPAFFFSKINAIQVLKDASSMKVFGHVSMRKVLIVVQYTFSLIFISTTIIGYNQYRGFINYDLGFKTENILNLNLQGMKGELLKKQLLEIPEVSGISKSLLVTSLGSIHGMQMKYNNAHDSAGVWLNFVDVNHLPLHRHVFIAGRNFQRREGGDETEVVVNEKLVKDFSIGGGDAGKALGEIVDLGGKKVAIIGVVRDFHYGTLEDKIQPMVFRCSNEPGGYLNVEVVSNNLPETMEKIETAWEKIDDVHPLEAAFYDDQIEQAYSQFSVMTKVIGFLGFLAVVISSMGLFGMVVFTTETRLKEISIRKVLGASEGKLIVLLSRGFLFLLGLSALIALPVTYFFFDAVVLTQFAYHTPIGFTGIIIGVLSVMGFAFLMIGTQTLKAARSNPATVLKVE